MAENDDSPLVRKAKDGDEAALTELIRRHEARVYRHALRLMGNQEDAEEVLQDTFLQVYRNLDRFEERSRFSTWIYRIATNEALMRLRKASRKREVSFETGLEGDDGRGENLRSFAQSPLEDLMDQEIVEHLEIVLAELPEEYRVVFSMRDIDGMSNAEVADVLDISVAAVKSRLHRSRVYLRDRLSKIYGERTRGPASKRESA